MKPKTRIHCALLFAVIFLSERSTSAGYIVLMADQTPFFPLIYDNYEGLAGNRQFFQNLSADSGSVLVTGGSPINPAFRFYNAVENVAAVFTSNELTATLLEDVSLVVADGRRSFTSAEAQLLSAVVRNGGSLFIGVDVTSPRSSAAEVDLEISAANSLLSEMRIGMSVKKERLDSDYRVARGSQIRTHPLTRGVSEFGYGLTGRVIGGVPLFRTTGRISFAAAVFVPEPCAFSLIGSVALLSLTAFRRRRHPY